jgi:hypothetical protein
MKFRMTVEGVQLDIFAEGRRRTAAKKPERRRQDPAVTEGNVEQLERVSDKIGALVFGFCLDRLTTGRPEFHATDLREYVAAFIPTAPASADRILRHLRRKNAVRYVVVDRRKSLYRLVAVATP